MDRFGNWSLRFVMITLSVTPLRRLTGWNWLTRFRRMLGLFTFFYVLMHFLTWLVLDQGLLVSAILEDIIKRPFITIGFIALLLAHGAGHYLNKWYSPPHGPPLANAAQYGLLDWHTRRMALLVAGKERHHRAVDLRRDSGRPARISNYQVPDTLFPEIGCPVPNKKPGRPWLVAPVLTTQLLRQATFTVCFSAIRILGSVTVRIPSFSSAWIFSGSTSTGRATVLISLP